MEKKQARPIPQAQLKNKPSHVAIIMDGNRRWAHSNNLSHTHGHKEALKRIREITDYAAQYGVEHITYWAWSTKNWKRSKEFIKDILGLFREQLASEELFKELVEKGGQIHHIGSLEKFPSDIKNKVKALLTKSPVKKVIDVNIALGYEGRDEIVRAVKKIIASGVSADSVDQSLISSHLDTAGQPDVDLLIRTGGEKRTSGYLIWQSADAEYYFTDDYMPDFTVDKFKLALDDYATRERRLGGDSKAY